MTAGIIALRKPPEAPVLWGELLGAVLRMKEPWLFFDGCGLAQEDCPDGRLRWAWTLARRLSSRRYPIDATSLFSAGRTSRLFSDSDHEWLLDLQAKSVLDDAGARRVSEDLRRHMRGLSMASRLEQAAREIRGSGLHPSRISGQLDGLLQSLARDYAPDETADADLHEVLARWDEAEKNPKARGLLLPSGIRVLDELIEGFPPNLTIIASPPGVGKTAVLGSLLRAQLRRDPELKIGLFGLEDGSEWLTRRLLADMLDMPLAHIARKQRSPEQLAKISDVGVELQGMLSRVLTYRHDSISTDEMVRRGTGWIYNHGVRQLVIDNLTEVEHTVTDWRQENARRMGVERTVIRLRNLAIKHQIPVVLLCHTVRPEGNRPRPGPPLPHECAESSRIEKAARLMLGLWMKNDQLRATVTKATEIKSGASCQFERLHNAVLVDEIGGKVINVQQESREEAAEKKAERDRESVEGSINRAKIKDRLVPKKPKEEEKKEPEQPPQLSLLPGDGEKRNDEP